MKVGLLMEAWMKALRHLMELVFQPRFIAVTMNVRTVLQNTTGFFHSHLVDLVLVPFKVTSHCWASLNLLHCSIWFLLMQNTHVIGMIWSVACDFGISIHVPWSSSSLISTIADLRNLSFQG